MTPRLAIVPLRTLAALLTLAAFLPACTRQEVRPPLEVRHYRVDWERVGDPVVTGGGTRVQGMLLPPTQWPLEGSLKRLLHGDFLGVWDAFDLRFHSSEIPTGVLEDLYDKGYVPAYVRVFNPASTPIPFTPVLLVVRDRAGVELAAAEPDELPRVFSRVDIERTVFLVVGVALLVAAVVAGREGRLDLRPVNVGRELARATSGAHVQIDLQVQANADVGNDSSPDASGTGATGAYVPYGQDRGLLRAGTLAPGEQREGLVLFDHKERTVDWGSAKLAVR
jgi:hypothetical protein